MMPCCVPALINPAIDTIYLSERMRFRLGYRSWLSRYDVDFGVVKSVAVDVDSSVIWRTGYDEEIEVAEIVRQLGFVEVLHLVSEYSLFNPDVNFDYSAWGTVSGEGEEGWRWVEPVDRELWDDVSRAKSWRETVGGWLEAEKERYGEEEWVMPEVVLSFVKFERGLMRKEYCEEEALRGLELVKVEDHEPVSLWSRSIKFVADKFRIRRRFGSRQEMNVLYT